MSHTNRICVMIFVFVLACGLMLTRPILWAANKARQIMLVVDTVQRLDNELIQVRHVVDELKSKLDKLKPWREGPPQPTENDS